MSGNLVLAVNAEDHEDIKKTDTTSGKEAETPLMETTDEESGKCGERAEWSAKFEFLLAVIGFAVDLGNVWRFPYVCYDNGGGAFLIPYVIMLIFGGLPLFYMELALGQFQRIGAISVWRRICPIFKGIGFGITVINCYVGMYYNTIISWAVYCLFQSFRLEVPWKSCGNSWNTENCTTAAERFQYHRAIANNMTTTNETKIITNYSTTAAEEFFYRHILEMNRSNGPENLGAPKWQVVLCLITVFVIVYFSLWKGIKSSGKAVWVTATLPYIVLVILLVRGVTLPGAEIGIYYYLTPSFDKLMKTQVWIAAASQIFFSLGPGFGVLLALSSYNKFHNNCFRDAMVTSMINCFTSFLAGFVVFSVLGYMAHSTGKPVESVAKEGPGLVFVVYPEAIATLKGSTFWAIIFFLMLISLGIDSTFGGMEACLTAICDEWPAIGRKREIFVAVFLLFWFLGALPSTTYGGAHVVALLDRHAAPISILFIVFLEAIAVNWFYGVNRFSQDVKSMIGFAPGLFWRVCWAGISPFFLLILFILGCYFYEPLRGDDGYEYPTWMTAIGWCIAMSSVLPIFIVAIYKLAVTPGSILRRLTKVFTPEELPKNDATMAMVRLEPKPSAPGGYYPTTVIAPAPAIYQDSKA